MLPSLPSSRASTIDRVSVLFFRAMRGSMGNGDSVPKREGSLLSWKEKT